MKILRPSVQFSSTLFTFSSLMQPDKYLKNCHCTIGLKMLKYNYKISKLKFDQNAKWVNLITYSEHMLLLKSVEHLSVS